MFLRLFFVSGHIAGSSDTNHHSAVHNLQFKDDKWIFSSFSRKFFRFDASIYIIPYIYKPFVQMIEINRCLF